MSMMISHKPFEIIEDSEHGVWKESWDHEYEFEVIKLRSDLKHFSLIK